MAESFKQIHLGRRSKRNILLATVSFGVIIFCFFIYFVTAQSTSSSLKLVHVVFRHGDRNPTETYTNDPYINYKWPGGWGSLTNKGKHQLYQLGQMLHARYKEYIDNNFSINDVYVRTSDVDRCHMSAGTFLAGMFPPKEEEIWNHDLLWQPIPIRSVPRDKDNLIAMKKKCNKYEEDLKNAYNSEAIQKINQENEELFKYLSKNTGDNINNITALEFLYNTLEIEDQNGLTLPSWVLQVYPHKMRHLAARSLSIFTETESMRRLKGGVILKEIIEHIKNKSLDQLKTKMFLYSAHDISLTNIIRTLGFLEDMKPDYGATLVIETHLTDGQDYEIKLLYFNNTWNDVPHILNMKTCGTPCYFRTFMNVLEPVIPINWEKECNNF